MAELDVRPSDLVVIRLTLRGRDATTVVLDETVKVSALGLGEGQGRGEVPMLDSAVYTRLLSSGKAGDVEKALQMFADFQVATAEYVAAGGRPPAEGLAQGVVDWVLETRPKGHRYTNDPNSRDGFVVSSAEMNISGPVQVGEERFWRVTAVGTWGC